MNPVAIKMTATIVKIVSNVPLITPVNQRAAITTAMRILMIPSALLIFFVMIFFLGNFNLERHKFRDKDHKEE